MRCRQKAWTPNLKPFAQTTGINSLNPSRNEAEDSLFPYELPHLRGPRTDQEATVEDSRMECGLLKPNQLFSDDEQGMVVIGASTKTSRLS